MGQGAASAAHGDAVKVEILDCCFAAKDGRARLYAKLRLPFGLILHDVRISSSGPKLWIELPRRPVLDADGRRKLQPNGWPASAPILTFDGRDAGEAFNAAVLAALRAAYPAELATLQQQSSEAA